MSKMNFSYASSKQPESQVRAPLRRSPLKTVHWTVLPPSAVAAHPQFDKDDGSVVDW